MNAIASPKLYDGPDGRKYVDSGKRSVEGEYDFLILRLATPEEIAGKTAGVRLSPESVGKAYRNGFGQKVVLSWDNDGSDFEYCAVEIDGKPTFHAYGNNGMSCLRDRRYDLISEWDEKAEAGVTPEGAATPNACTAKKAASAPPAQPEIADDDPRLDAPPCGCWPCVCGEVPCHCASRACREHVVPIKDCACCRGKKFLRYANGGEFEDGGRLYVPFSQSDNAAYEKKHGLKLAVTPCPECTEGLDRRTIYEVAHDAGEHIRKVMEARKNPQQWHVPIAKSWRGLGIAK